MKLDTFTRLLNHQGNTPRCASMIACLAQEVPSATRSSAKLASNKSMQGGKRTRGNDGNAANEMFLPGLPFDALYIFETNDAAFTLDSLIGMSPNQLLNKTSGRAKREISQVRKICREANHGNVPIDLLALSAGFGFHSRRLTMLEDHLAGKATPVLEFLLIDHWMKKTGHQFPDPSKIVIPCNQLSTDVLPHRQVRFRQYQEMLLPILGDLSHMTVAQQANPDDRSWALFNAWWAIASLYGETALISDVAVLWPNAADLLIRSSRAIYNPLHTDPPEQGVTRLAAHGRGLLPISGHNDLRQVLQFSNAAATTGSLLENLDWLAEQAASVSVGLDAASASKEQRFERAMRQQRESMVVAHTLNRQMSGMTTCERLSAACDLLGTRHDGIDRLQHQSSALISAGEAHEKNPQTSRIEIFDGDGARVSNSTVEEMVDWMAEADRLCDSIEHFVAEVDKEMGDVNAAEMPVTERMSRLQRLTDKFQEWQSSADESLASIIQQGMQLPWSGITVTDIPDANAHAPTHAVHADPANAPVAEEAREDNADTREQHLAALEAELHTTKDALNNERHRSRALQDQLDRAAWRQQDAQPSQPPMRQALRTYSESTTCTSVLALLEATHPERVRVLPSAIESAQDADSSLSAHSVLRKTMALVMDGWEILEANRPPYDMQEVIPGELALNESNSTRQDTRCMQQRTFMEKHDDGSMTQWEMSWHLKLDHRHRLYFAWDDVNRQIVIGHAGGHLGLASVRS